MLAPLQRQQRVSSLYSAPGGPLSHPACPNASFSRESREPSTVHVRHVRPLYSASGGPWSPPTDLGPCADPFSRIPPSSTLREASSRRSSNTMDALPVIFEPSSQRAPPQTTPLPQHQRPAPQSASSPFDRSRNQERPVASRDPPTLSQ